MRLELTGKTELAIRAINVLSTQPAGQVMRGEDLADVLDTTKNYLPQVLSPLIREEWVTSTAGPAGGYQLAADNSKVTLLQVIEAVEGPAEDGTCVLKGTPCPDRGPCALHDPWTRARNALLNELAGTSVAEVHQ
jgi:Rrf2 family protein